VLVMAALGLVAPLVGQQLLLDEEQGEGYLVDHGVLFRIDLKTLQVLGRKTLVRGPGPWDNRLVVARSEDGLTFADTGVVVSEGGGVPDLMWDGQGRLVAVFQYFPEDSDEDFDRIAVAFSTDDGKTWAKPQPIEIEGLPAQGSRSPCDPDLVLLPDGRVRLYFTCDFHAEERKWPRTLSAVSDDCVHFRLEEGERFADPPNPVLDPSAIRLGETWHLFIPRMAPGTPAYHLQSQDGLHFERLDDLQIPGIELRGNIVPAPGGYRFYGCGQPGVTIAFSPDGSQWRLEAASIPWAIGDPAVVRMNDGAYLMVHMQRR
jgi:hypothetical protein